MNLKTFTFLSIGLCVGGALVSVVLENTQWFGVDAGSSWSLVAIIGYALAFLTKALAMILQERQIPNARRNTGRT